jgi:hypothetical protein
VHIACLVGAAHAPDHSALIVVAGVRSIIFMLHHKSRTPKAAESNSTSGHLYAGLHGQTTALEPRHLSVVISNSYVVLVTLSRHAQVEGNA